MNFNPEERKNSTNQYRVPVICKGCTESVPPGQFQNHSCQHSPNKAKEVGNIDPVQCPDCGSLLKNKNSLKVHKSTYHRKVREGLSTGVKLNRIASPLETAPGELQGHVLSVNLLQHPEQTSAQSYRDMKPPTTPPKLAPSEKVEVKVDPDEFVDSARENSGTSSNYQNSSYFLPTPPRSVHDRAEMIDFPQSASSEVPIPQESHSSIAFDSNMEDDRTNV